MRQIYTLKFKSSLLREFGYKIETTFDEAKSLKNVIALADSQMLRTIRDIRDKEIDFDKVEEYYAKREEYDNQLAHSNKLTEKEIEEIVNKRKGVQNDIRKKKK